ncbi:MAG: tetraacyldisaccharide 4'-kinase [Candidatus Aminicenantes bacterium]|nr:tetraacyldisaccharide 4'-kinase [Candidatus Aminicenantes bacterium]
MNLLLQIACLLNRVGCRLKAWVYARGLRHPRFSPIPVVSVGNIALGGSEKTPLVLDILSHFLKTGFKPAMISRGYKGTLEQNGGILSDGRAMRGGWREAGDEPYMAAIRLPDIGVFVGRDRLSSCRTAAGLGFDLAVLDDGFQHLQLHRDVDIVLVDPSENKSLRESYSALNRADILLTKVKEPNGGLKEILLPTKLPPRVFPYKVVLEGIYKNEKKESWPPSLFRKGKSIAVCGIAAPERFFGLLSQSGITPEAEITFPDHWPYPPSSLESIVNTFEKTGADCLITTEKDIAKLRDQKKLQDIPLYYVRIGLVLEPDFYIELTKRITHAQKKT